MNLIIIVYMPRIQEYIRRGGGVQAWRPENSLDNVFIIVLNLFYSLQRGPNGFITEKTLLFQGSNGSPTFSRGGGPTISRCVCVCVGGGGQC